MVWTMRGPATTQASVPKGRGRKFGRKTACEGEERREILPFPSHALFALLARPESTCPFLSNACHAGYGIRGNVACERDLLHCMSSLV